MSINTNQICERLAYKGDGLHHKKSIRNVLRINISPEPVLLLGVGVYNGIEEELLDPEAMITFDRTTTTIKIWSTPQNENNRKNNSEKLLSNQIVIVNTEQARKLARKKFVNKVKHTMTVWLDEPLLLNNNVSYELEHNIFPTDVQNQYSGWPITVLGSDLWTCYGTTKSPLSVSNETTFTFSDPLFKSGRSCLWEGQIPYFMFWKL